MFISTSTKPENYRNNYAITSIMSSCDLKWWETTDYWLHQKGLSKLNKTLINVPLRKRHNKCRTLDYLKLVGNNVLCLKVSLATLLTAVYVVFWCPCGILMLIIKDIKSLGALCSSVRWAAKSSVTWFGSPPGKAAHIGQIDLKKKAHMNNSRLQWWLHKSIMNSGTKYIFSFGCSFSLADGIKDFLKNEIPLPTSFVKRNRRRTVWYWGCSIKTSLNSCSQTNTSPPW